jgi:hypothetical protein
MTVSTVSAEILAGHGLSLSQAARRFPPGRDNRPVAPSTVGRWAHVGVCRQDGARVRLEVVKLGGRWLTSGPAIERFIAHQTPSLDPPHDPTPRTPQEREDAAERARRDLEDLGL